MTAGELRAAMAALPEPITDLNPPHWEFWRWSLWKLITDGEDPATFYSWPCIFHTMLVNHWIKPVQFEYESLPKSSPWKEAISAPAVGGPIDFHALTPYSRNLIHQGYHLYRFRQATGRQISEMETIVEIGGGYGAMCLVARRLGFQGRYVIYDLPEFSLLQQWYLSQVEIEGVEFVTEIPETSFFKKRYSDLMIGLYSLSEMAEELRRDILEAFPALSYLFLYSQTWVSHDNREYFQERIPLDEFSWHHEEIAHLPDPGNWYTFGWA